MTAQAVFADAARRADEQNGAVIAIAFRRASVCCPDCKFPENVAEFRSLLFDYTELKKQIHRVIKRDWCNLWRHSTLGYHYVDANSLESRARTARRQLTEIWPCQACTERFNPTGKYKYPGFSKPEPRGFLE